ncbi:hypothetical protein EYR41_002409 [Orbilia oligospora]|uniref:Uncharacterized protein n=1 Tax=Orbilia oligospora TaxID=2813651 RepID=A0A8H2HD37_ORBOL|nr:hypothetical protein EYR41_002409 [Orbilia oligospora]
MVERGETSEKLSNQTMSFLQAGTLSVAPLDGVSLVGSGFCVETGITGLEGLLGIVLIRSLLEAQSEKHARKGKGKGKGRVFRRRSISLLPLLSFCGTKNCARPGWFFLFLRDTRLDGA